MIPAEIATTVPMPDGEARAPTLPNLIRSAARQYGPRELAALGERRVTYSQAEEESALWARGLLALGVGKGSRVALLMPNGPDWIVGWFASARTGALTVALSTFFQAPELSWGLRHNDVGVLLVGAAYLGADYIERLERAVPGLAQATSPDLTLPSHPYLRHIIVWGDCDRPWAMKGPHDLVAAARAYPAFDAALLAAVEAAVTPDDSLITICTSGSTAEPKAVVHSHGAAARATWQFLPHYDWRIDDRAYSGHPFFWIGGLNVNLLPILFTGGCSVCSASPKAADLAAMFEREGVNRVAMWPAQAKGVIEAAAAEGRDLSGVRWGLFEPRERSGRVIPPAERMGGVFGMTETFGMHSLWPLDEPAPPGKAGSMGLTLPGVERRIVDRETGAPLPRGEVGELQLRGHSLMQGYYGRERRDCFTADGFFATGDLCREDEDGFLWFQGRRFEMIKTTGANVSPREVELALMKTGRLREAVVFGMADELRGEVVAGVVVPAPGETLDAAAIKAELKAALSSYKVPKRLYIRADEDLPRTHSGKVDKARLRAAAMEWDEG
ncbi:MAG: lcfB 1 [Caulobacter sp.]|nr:lcfB 1 [Caulobacter sp.]